MKTSGTLTINGKVVEIENERNLLELIRKSGVEIPTFCYHSELSVYGACRMCMIEVEGRGIMASCSTLPEPGLKIKTSTEEIRKMRRVAVELLLANHEQACPTCVKSTTCKLQHLANNLGVTKVRFKPVHQAAEIDCYSPSLVRNPNKCILCGDCVRMCDEVQGVGCIDFSFRGHEARVGPAFGKNLSDVECVFCGQCASVCPTGAITPKSEIDQVWKALEDPKKKVVVQIAPAVRVALQEAFGETAGQISTGRIVSALRLMGFDRVFDTSFAADLTVFEEATEFLGRLKKKGSMPQFTSCCPGWVKFSEQFFPELLPKLSTCKSPQQMFGSLLKEVMPENLSCEKKDLVVVSIMPCTAKKFEAKRAEFIHDGIADVDHVITTQELAIMIKEMGIEFHKLANEEFDLPFGFASGAGVIFGASGGVSEAVLRFAYEKITGQKLMQVEFLEMRGKAGIREARVTLGETTLRLAIVHSLSNAKKICEDVRAGKYDYDLIEVMACPGGCIGGGGQPVSFDRKAKSRRARGLYESDRMLTTHKPQDNPYLTDLYEQKLGEIGGEKSHHLFHTHYQSRRRISVKGMPLLSGEGKQKLEIGVCVGTSCYLKGSQTLLHSIIKHVDDQNLKDAVDVKATFCFEKCDKGPTVRVGKELIHGATLDKTCAVIKQSVSTFKN